MRELVRILSGAYRGLQMWSQELLDALQAGSFVVATAKEMCHWPKPFAHKTHHVLVLPCGGASSGGGPKSPGTIFRTEA